MYAYVMYIVQTMRTRTNLGQVFFGFLAVISQLVQLLLHVVHLQAAHTL